jgi:hypothetical protein
MNGRNRRAFLAEVGRGMLISSLGAAAAVDLGLAPAIANEDASRVTFGELESLVALMQETPPDDLLPIVVDKLRVGVALKDLVAAGSLANVRAFAGQDYTGYHTFMALTPALKMAGQLSPMHQPLPVLKVLYRNSSRIQSQGAGDHDALHPVEAWTIGSSSLTGANLRDAVRAIDWDLAEAQFLHMADGPPGEAFNHLQYAVQDEVDVHRVVLSWRALAMLDVAGEQYAHTLLRQSLRYCLDAEQRMQEKGYARSPIRELLPRLLEDYGLPAKATANRKADDVWVGQLASVIFSGSREQAAEAVAAALSEGFASEDIGEAISIAANLLVLHDPGRREQNSSKEKPPGCVHGDSVGVHASDSANAWRHISRVGDARNRVSSLIVGAFHTAGQSNWVTKEPYDYSAQLSEIRATEANELLAVAEEAIKSNEQARASAAIHRYGDLGLPVRPVFDLMLRYAISEDGALHAEKYYQTVAEEYESTRPAFRWRQMIALARVTASEHGFPAPGYQQARELLRLA